MDRVLFVDDEYMILNSIKRELLAEPFEKYFANNAEEAIRIMTEMEISVLVTDMKMPEINGLGLLKIAKQDFPNVVKIVLSGYTSLPQVLVTVNQGDIFKFITKPWEDKVLKDALREAIDYYNYRMELQKVRSMAEKKSESFKSIIGTYDEKMEEIKREVNLIQKLVLRELTETQKMVGRWDFHMESSERMMANMQMARNPLMSVLATMPTVTRRFSAKQLLEEIQQDMESQEVLMTVDYGIDSHISGQFKGRFDLFKAIIRSMIQTYILDERETEIALIVSSDQPGDQCTRLKVVVKAHQRHFLHGPAQDIVTHMLKDLAAYLGGDFVLMDLGEKRVILFSALCGV